MKFNSACHQLYYYDNDTTLSATVNRRLDQVVHSRVVLQVVFNVANQLRVMERLDHAFAIEYFNLGRSKFPIKD